MTRQEDIWNCEGCHQLYGRHDLWFEGICEKCKAEKDEDEDNYWKYIPPHNED
jgi:hypothetical protein